MATVSKVFVANLALSLMGTKSKIESLTENSREASEMDLWYELTRRNLMERFDWGFARTREDLALDDEAAPSGVWGFQYIYPADCLKARHLEIPGFSTSTLRYGPGIKYNKMDQIPFSVEESPDAAHRVILTNLEDAVLVYTRDLVDPARYPQAFILVLAHALAANTAYNITGKIAIADGLSQKAEGVFQVAAAADANESHDEPPKDTDWIRARS